MNIRHYTTNDYQAVKDILSSAGMFDEVWDSEEHLGGKIKADPESILLAVEAERVIGCLLIIRDSWTCFLYRLAVDGKHRKKGIGTALLNKAEDQLRQVGAEEVALYVDAANDDLQSYYENRGYIKGGTYRCMYKKL